MRNEQKGYYDEVTSVLMCFSILASDERTILAMIHCHVLHRTGRTT